MRPTGDQTSNPQDLFIFIQRKPISPTWRTLESVGAVRPTNNALVCEGHTEETETLKCPVCTADPSEASKI